MNMGADAARRRTNWLVAAVILCGALGALAGAVLTHQNAPAPGANTLLAQYGAQAGAIAIVTDDGRAHAWGDLVGRPRAVFFGFTHCPEICPTTIADLTDALDRIGAPADALRVDFVTVDPERDTPTAMRAYLASFGGRVRGVSGARASIDALMASYRAQVRRVETGAGDYTMDHTTTVYLLDARGVTIDVMGYQTPPERMDAQLRALLASGRDTRT